MPQLINGGPLDGGMIDFDVEAPSRFRFDTPPRVGGPGTAVYEDNGRGIYQFKGWQDGNYGAGEGVTP